MHTPSLRDLQRLLETPSSITVTTSVTATTVMHTNPLFLLLLDIYPSGVVLADAQGNFLVTNEKLRKAWCSYGGGDNNWSQSFFENSDVCFNVDGSSVKVEDWPMSITIRTRQPVKSTMKVKVGNTWVYIEITTSPLLDDNGDLSYVFLFVEDITEKLLREEQKNFARVQNDFLARMSHELRTPMHGIQGMLDCIIPTSEQQAHDFDVLRRSADGLLRTVNDILDYTKYDAERIDVEPTSFSLHHMVEDISCLFNTKCPFTVRISSSIPENVFGDEHVIKQCLNNLCNNALKFVRPNCIPEVSLDVQSDDENVLFIIKDKGIGMTPETLSKIFQPFVQANSSITRTYGGTGLGLTIVKKLANKMGGDVTVKSVINRGSTFTLSLPLIKTMDTVDTVDFSHSPPNKRRKVDRTLEEKANNSKIRLLLAEDNPINKVVTVSLLKKNGFQVDAVENGLEVLDRIAADGTYDMLLLDIQMPKMGGHETCKILRERQWNKPIVALTASAMESDRTTCLEVGMDDYMSKPFKIDELESKILKLCRGDLESLSYPIARFAQLVS